MFTVGGGGILNIYFVQINLTYMSTQFTGHQVNVLK